MIKRAYITVVFTIAFVVVTLQAFAQAALVFSPMLLTRQALPTRLILRLYGRWIPSAERCQSRFHSRRNLKADEGRKFHSRSTTILVYGHFATWGASVVPGIGSGLVGVATVPQSTELQNKFDRPPFGL
jgi:hypothetical protein